MLLWRAVIGFCCAAVVAWIAYRARSLTDDGAVAATLVGTAAIATGWNWAGVLLAFFLSATLLSRWRGALKQQRTASIAGKGDERDARQVLANGGVFALAMLVVASTGNATAATVALASIATATADTWATEIGTAAGGTPRSVISWRAIPTGTSGGVTTVGTLAAIAGAAFIVVVARWLIGSGAPLMPVIVGGILGAVCDSVIGATMQARRWCDACDQPTERRTHLCGSATRHVGGIAPVDNDLVNLMSTCIGAVIAVWLAR
jgi:uncharacterized protein (TIGR00297 family)